MSTLYRALGIILLVSILTACGGSSSGGDSPQPQPRVDSTNFSISKSTIFPSIGSYSLQFTNDSNRKLTLIEPQSRLRAKALSAIINTSACRNVAPNSNCLITITPPSGATGSELLTMKFNDGVGNDYTTNTLINYANIIPSNGFQVNADQINVLTSTAKSNVVAIPFVKFKSIVAVAIQLAVLALL
jgi:hypothetical protein